jgi:hypothetical protein
MLPLLGKSRRTRRLSKKRDSLMSKNTTRLKLRTMLKPSFLLPRRRKNLPKQNKRYLKLKMMHKMPKLLLIRLKKKKQKLQRLRPLSNKRSLP